jgi:hypothetical protein
VRIRHGFRRPDLRSECLSTEDWSVAFYAFLPIVVAAWIHSPVSGVIATAVLFVVGLLVFGPYSTGGGPSRH